MSDFDALGFTPHEAPAQSSAPAGDHFADLGFEPHQVAPAQKQPSEMSHAELSQLPPEQASKELTRRYSEAEDAKGDAFMDTLTLGHLPQIKAKIQQIYNGEGMANDENYVKRRDAEIANLKAEGEKFPVGTTVSRAGGAIAPMLASGGAAAPAEAAEAVPFITRLGKSVLTSAGYGAAYGAAQNPGDVEGKVDPIQLSDRAENAYEGAKFGAKMGLAVPLAVEGIAKSPVAAKWVGQKFGKVAAGVPEEVTGRYLENPDAINSAPSRTDIANKVIELKKQSDGQVTQAAEDLQAARQSMADSKMDTRAGLQDEKFSAGHDLNEAQSKFNEAKQQFKETLKSNNLTHMAGEVTGAHEELGKKVSQASTQGYEILAADPNVKVGVDGLINDSLQKNVSSQFINGVAKSDEAGKTAQTLRSWQQRLFDMTKNTDGNLSGTQAKELMQELDKITTYDPANSGPGADKLNSALKDLRSDINKAVRVQSKAYADHMDTVTAPLTKLYEKTDKLYSTPEKAIQNLNNLDSEKGQALHVPILQKLEEYTGKSLKEPVAGYLLNQKVLNTPSMFDEIINSTPEGKALAGARGRMEEISNPERARALNEKTNAPFQQKVSAAESSLDAAKEKAKNFSGITENSIFSKTKALTGANSYGPEQQIGRIDKEFGTNFDRDIRARNDADQFSKVDTAGSRKSIVGGAFGGAMGWIFGKSPEAVAIGTAAGVKAGAIADKYSGQLFKKMLDAGMKAGKGTEYLAQSLSKLPPEQATAAIMRYKSATKGPEKWALDGYTKIMDHATDSDKDMIASSLDELMKSKSGQKLLVSASDLKPGTKAMDNVLAQLKTQMKADEGGK